MAIDPKTGAGTNTDDLLEYVKFSSIAWTHDHKVRICPVRILLLSYDLCHLYRDAGYEYDTSDHL